MPYNLTNFNGSVFTSLADGVVDKQFSSSIYLLGKNVTGYGTYQNDNFLWLLQNFAGLAEPINKLTGQTWFDTNSDTLKLKVYNGSQWNALTTTINTGTAPVSSLGDLWYNPNTNQVSLGIGTGTSWQLIGPEAVEGFRKTKFESGPLADVNTQTHAAIRLFDDGQLLAVVTTSSFDVSYSEDVYLAGIQTTISGLSFATGFGVSAPTLTASTVTSAVLSVSGFSYITSMYGVDVTVSKVISPSIITDGITTGNPATQGIITGTWSLSAGSELIAPSLTTTGITTGDPATQGIITGTWSLSAGSTLSSTYADLAENYKANDTYSPGQVMEFGGDAEITMCDTDMSTKVAGIISTAPAFLLNDQYEIEGYTYSLALTGRVPCYVRGVVNKGDMLVSAGGGCARAELNPKPGTIIARAIDSTVDGGMIEVQVCRG